MSEQDDRIPVTLTEATYDETGVHIRGTIPRDEAVRLGLTEGAANVSGFSLVNRWAAFTDDELDIAHTALALSPRDSEPLNHEVAAEIERRKSRT